MVSTRKIPIYILTNFADEEDEFAGGKWSVEYIIPKEGLSDEEGARTAKARILRHIDVYEDILDERAKRFNELLRKSLNDDLDEAELQELEELQVERAASTLAHELEEVQTLAQIVKTNEKLIDLLNRTAEGESEDDG